ncbi:hypothetical protein KCU91_g5701, partial [Aureobasidium melanogenum]
MRFPSFAFAAVAGLWQQPLAPEEETVTSTRHIHITKTVTNSASTIYAVRMGTSTVCMEYLPATMMAKSVPWQALPTTHLELRSEATSTMHIKVTQTVAQVQATVFASKVGTSISTITDAPQSLIDEAAKDAAEMSSSQLAAAISSAEADALAHSTVAFLTGTDTSLVSASASSTQPDSAQYTNSSSVSTLAQPLAANPSASGGNADALPPIGLELRSNAETTTTVQQQATTTEAPATVLVVIYGSSTSTMTSVPPSLLAGIASSQVSDTSVSSVSQQTEGSGELTQPTQTSDAAVAIDTNAAQIKSFQTALIRSSSYSDKATAIGSAASSSTTTNHFSTSSSQVMSTSSASSTSNKVYTIPVTMTSATSTSSVENTVVPSAAETSDSGPSLTVYGSQSSSSSSAADIAADNAAGASGGDSVIFLVLFVIARRRQWKIRESIVRASRRITGRFSSHPNKTTLRSEKEPTLPIIEPRQPISPRPAPSSRRQGFANIDATLHTNYRGVETVGRGASRGPEAWRKAMAQQRLQTSKSQRKKPELRVDTGVASRLEEGRDAQGGQKKRGNWTDLFRSL